MKNLTKAFAALALIAAVATPAFAASVDNQENKVLQDAYFYLDQPGSSIEVTGRRSWGASVPRAVSLEAGYEQPNQDPFRCCTRHGHRCPDVCRLK